MDKLETIEALLATADAGSFAAAGRSLGKSRDYVRKAVSELEVRLGLLLIHRTTRKATLTEVGAEYVGKLRPVLLELNAAEDGAQSQAKGIGGKLVVNAPLMWGITVLRGLISHYLQIRPDIQLDLRLSDEITLAPGSDNDITLRLTSHIDPELNSISLARIRRRLYAAPAYLEERGFPKSVHSLQEHQCLLYGNLVTGSVWVLRRRGKEVRLSVKGRFSCTNGLVLAEAAVTGHGIVTLPDFLARQYVEEAKLVQVLPDWEPLPLNLYAIIEASRTGSVQVHSFINFLKQALAVEKGE